MGLITRSVDLYFTYRFLKNLTSRWEDLPAYKEGIIDKHGKVLRKMNTLKTESEKDSFTYFDLISFKLKRAIEKTPLIGQLRLTSFAAALYLLKESVQNDMNDPESLEREFIKHLRQNYGVEVVKKSINESKEQEYARLGYIKPGVYQFADDDIGVFITENTFPIGESLGCKVYDFCGYLTTQDNLIPISNMLCEDGEGAAPLSGEPTNNVSTTLPYTQEKDPRIGVTTNKNLNIGRKKRKNGIVLFRSRRKFPLEVNINASTQRHPS